MEPTEVPPVERDDSPALRVRECEDLRVCESLAGHPGILDRQDIVSHPSQLLGDRDGKIFVGVEPGHQAASFS
jgi:hypothetical protein